MRSTYHKIHLKFKKSNCAKLSAATVNCNQSSSTESKDNKHELIYSILCIYLACLMGFICSTMCMLNKIACARPCVVSFSIMGILIYCA